jgi:hypothetical protein
MAPTDIKALCPVCGDIVLHGNEVRVTEYLDDEASSFYTFTCPECHEEYTKPAPRMVRHLLGISVPRPLWRKVQAAPPPLDENDLLAFCVSLYSSTDDEIVRAAQ